MQCSQSAKGLLCIAAAVVSFLWGVLAEAAQLSWLCGADVLLKLVQERGFEMFVHPIAPVLNETRHVVAPFNHKLQQQVQPVRPCLVSVPMLAAVLGCIIVSLKQNVNNASQELS